MLYPPGTPTQPEIIAIALSKLNIKSTEVFADIGCGSGSVSIAASGFAKHVFAIDNRDDAINAASENIKECSINNISLLKGEAITLTSRHGYGLCIHRRKQKYQTGSGNIDQKEKKAENAVCCKCR